MKKIFAIFIVLAMLVAGIAIAAPAEAASATVTITATGRYVALTIATTTWALGTVASNVTSTWGGSSVQDTVTNTGNWSANVAVTGANLVNGTDTWVLGSTPGSMVYELQINSAQATSYALTVSTAGSAWIASLGVSSTYKFSMVFSTPTAWSATYAGASLSGNVTFVATDAG